jgi:hypothetical protein
MLNCLKVSEKDLYLPGADSLNLKGSTAPGSTWRVNMTRHNNPMRVYSSWAPVEKGFGNPHEFGQWNFP